MQVNRANPAQWRKQHGEETFHRLRDHRIQEPIRGPALGKRRAPETIVIKTAAKAA
jgi:hypothetical protein